MDLQVKERGATICLSCQNGAQYLCIMRDEPGQVTRSPTLSFSKGPSACDLARNTLDFALAVLADVRTFEILLRTYDVRSEMCSARLLGMAESTPNGKRSKAQGGSAQKRPKVEEAQRGADEGLVPVSGAVDGGEGELTGTRSGASNEVRVEGSAAPSGTVASDSAPTTEAQEGSEHQLNPVPPVLGSVAKVILARPTAETRGHTGYLTFARRAC